MKVLLINKFWRQAGGVEVHAERVSQWLHNRGHEVVPFAMREDETIDNEYLEYFPSHVEFRAEGVRDTIKGVSRATLSHDSRRSLRALIAQEKPEAAYVLHVYHQLGTAILNELRDAGVPMVLSIHDYKVGCPNYRLYSEKTGSVCTSCLESKWASVYEPTLKGCWSGSRKAGIALGLEAALTKMRKSYQLPGSVTTLNALQERAAMHNGIARDRIVRVPHPVELEKPRTSVHPDAPFLYLGRLVPEKGVDVLLRAAAHTGARIVVAGDGRSRPDLEQLARELSVDADFVGQVNQEAGAGLLRQARALVVPSTWHEVSPLVVLEAIANDVPVVASRMGGMTDQLEGGRGFLFTAGDAQGLSQALKRIQEDPEHAQERSRVARRFASENWSVRKWEEAMQNAFRLAGVPI